MIYCNNAKIIGFIYLIFIYYIGSISVYKSDRWPNAFMLTNPRELEQIWHYQRASNFLIIGRDAYKLGRFLSRVKLCWLVFMIRMPQMEIEWALDNVNFILAEKWFFPIFRYRYLIMFSVSSERIDATVNLSSETFDMVAIFTKNKVFTEV